MTKPSTIQHNEVTCPLCGQMEPHLGPHLRLQHNLSVSDFLSEHPNHPVAAPSLVESFEAQFAGIREPLRESDLKVTLAGYTFPIHLDVSPEDCLPIPSSYRLPSRGELGKAVKRALRALRGGRSLWISGRPGVGKDALIHKFCGITRTPSMCLSIQPTEDIGSWFFCQNFDKGELVYQEGRLTRALRDGYRTSSGRILPYLILISDADRATPQQAEFFRLIADSIQGRIQGPKGETYPVLPGTLIVMTANSTGSGDEKGQCISANVQDASLLDRIMRFVQFSDMSWEDILPILQDEFPLFAAEAQAEAMFEVIGKCLESLRRALSENSLAGTFSFRGLQRWLGDCEDIIRYDGIPLSFEVVQHGFESWMDSLPDQANRMLALQTVKPHFDKLGKRTVSESTEKLKVPRS